MADSFQSTADASSAPASRAESVSPHDTNPLTDIPKALYVGTGGNVTMRGSGGGVDRVWKNVPAGAILPFRAAYVRATGRARPTSWRCIDVGARFVRGGGARAIWRRATGDQRHPVRGRE